MDRKRSIAVFDFDGTLTTADSLPAFIRFARGTVRYYAGLLACAPMLAAYVMRLVSNTRAKQYLFSHFFKGMGAEEFAALGRRFATRIDTMARRSTLNELERFVSEGARVYVVSASMEQWVEPWCRNLGVYKVLGTLPEIRDGVLTGRFLTPNCYGAEKVRRLKECEPDRDTYFLTAYGDSHGDDAMLAFADKAVRVTDR